MESIEENIQYPPSNYTVLSTINDLDIIIEDILRLFWHLQLGEVEPDLKLLLREYSRLGQAFMSTIFHSPSILFAS